MFSLLQNYLPALDFPPPLCGLLDGQLRRLGVGGHDSRKQCVVKGRENDPPLLGLVFSYGFGGRRTHRIMLCLVSFNLVNLAVQALELRGATGGIAHKVDLGKGGVVVGFLADGICGHDWIIPPWKDVTPDEAVLAWTQWMGGQGDEVMELPRTARTRGWGFGSVFSATPKDGERMSRVYGVVVEE